MKKTYFLAFPTLFASVATDAAQAADGQAGMDATSIIIVATITAVIVLSIVVVAAIVLRRKNSSREKASLAAAALNEEKILRKQAIKEKIMGTSDPIAATSNDDLTSIATSTSTELTLAVANTVHAVGSPLAILEASSMLDPVGAGHGVVILVEMIRHAKETAQKIHDQAENVVRQADVTREHGLDLNSDLSRAVEMASTAMELATQTMAVNDEMSSPNPGALLIWQRAQLDACLSLLAMARSNLVPAIDQWQTGIEQYRIELTAQAHTKKREANRAHEQEINFIEAIQSGFAMENEPSSASPVSAAKKTTKKESRQA